MRSTAPLALVLLLLAGILPSAASESGVIAPNGHTIVSINATQTPSYLRVEWNSSAPIDVFVMDSGQLQDYESEYSWTPQDVRILGLNETHRIVAVPVSPGEYVSVVLDNSPKPRVVDHGETHPTVSFDLDARFVPIHHPTSMGDLAATATFARPFWEFPFWLGLGISGVALLFLILAIAGETIAIRADPKRWLDVGIMILVGALFTGFVEHRGVVTGRAWVLALVPAILAFFAVQRYRSTRALAPGAFAAAFWGVFIGGDVLGALFHGDAIASDAAIGRIYVIGGAGWKDGLVVVPIAALVGLALILVRTSGPRGLATLVGAPASRLRMTGRRVSPLEIVIDAENPSSKPSGPIVFRVSHVDSARVAMVKLPGLPPKDRRPLVLKLPEGFEEATTINVSAIIRGAMPLAFQIAPPDPSEPTPTAP